MSKTIETIFAILEDSQTLTQNLLELESNDIVPILQFPTSFSVDLERRFLFKKKKLSDCRLIFI